MMNPEASAELVELGTGLLTVGAGEHSTHKRAHVDVLSVGGRPIYCVLAGAFRSFFNENGDDALSAATHP